MSIIASFIKNTKIEIPSKQQVSRFRKLCCSIELRGTDVHKGGFSIPE